MKPTSFVFVSQAGKLEGMSLVLAASIRAAAGFEHELIAAVPTPASTWGQLSPGTLDAYEELQVSVEEIDNPWGRAYPIGNKFGCLCVNARHPVLVFLDTDIVMLDLPLDGGPGIGPVAAVPASRRHHSMDQWAAIYAAAGVAMPAQETCATAGGDSGPAYFNSGVVAIETASGFGTAWLETARRIDSDPAIPESARRPWLDQVALPVTAAALGIGVSELPIAYNFPSWEKQLTMPSPTVFYHYQRPSVLLRSAQLFRRAAAAVASFPRVRREVRKHAAVRMFASTANYRAKRWYYRSVLPRLTS